MEPASTASARTAPRRIHILGASGSGTTTLGAALAERLGHVHLDTDSFYWEPTEPPFQRARPIGERHGLLLDAIGSARNWVLSGSLVSWGDPFIPHFDIVIYMSLPAPVLRVDGLLTTDEQVELLLREFDKKERHGEPVEP